MDRKRVILRKLGLQKLVLLASLLLATSGLRAAVIEYETTALGDSRWRYDYVLNTELAEAATQFSVFFEPGLFDNLTVDASPAAWDSIVLQPEPLLSADGLFDSLYLGDLADLPAVVSGFALSFDYLGIGMPGAQPFELLNDFGVTIFSGTTALLDRSEPPVAVPEPETLGLLLGLLALLVLRSTAAAQGRPAALGLTLLSCLWTGSATAEISVTGLQAVSGERVGRTLFEYELEIRILNDEIARREVSASFRSTTATTEVLTDRVAFGDLAPNETTVSLTTLRIRQDRRVRFDPAALIPTFDELPPNTGAAALNVVAGGSSETLTLGTEGGELNAAANGIAYSLNVPANAVDDAVTFELQPMQYVEGLPISLVPLAVARLGPAGADFRDAPVSLSFTGITPPPGLQLIGALADDAGDAFTFLPLFEQSIPGAPVTIEVPHFSLGAIIALDPDDPDLPPPPEGADAETRAQHFIAIAIARYFEEFPDVEAPDAISLSDYPPLRTALFDWLEDPDDGLLARVSAAGTDADTTAAEYRELLREGGRFLLNAGDLLQDDEAFDLQEDLTTLFADLFAELVVSGLNACGTNSTAAFDELQALKGITEDFFPINTSLFNISESEPFGQALERAAAAQGAGSSIVDALENFTFSCRTNIRFLVTQLLSSGVGSSVEIPYELILEDGTVTTEVSVLETIDFPVTADESGLDVSSATGGVIVATTTTFLDVIEAVGFREGSTPATVTVFSPPAFSGSFSASISGTAFDCIDEGDNGPGSLSGSASFGSAVSLSPGGSLSIALNGGISGLASVRMQLNSSSVSSTVISGSGSGSAAGSGGTASFGASWQATLGGSVSISTAGTAIDPFCRYTGGISYTQ